MATYSNRTFATGDLIYNAPITANNVLDIPAGAFCKCDCGSQDGTLSTKAATSALATAPTNKLVSAVVFVDNDGVSTTVALSKQYFFSTLTAASLYTELQNELRSIFGRYLVNAGGVTAAKVTTNLVVTVTARTPFVASSLIVDGVAVAFA